MAKKTRIYPIFPMNKGLDLSSVPGSQDPRSLTRSKNAVIRVRPSLRKRPGARRLDYIGNDSGTTAAIQFFATRGTAKIEEIIRVRNGRVESLRDDKFIELKKEDADGVAQEFEVSPTDTITFTRFDNVLIINFENTAPVYYTIRGNLRDLPLLSEAHESVPPLIATTFLNRYAYAGRQNDPDVITLSEPGNPFSYIIANGADSISVNVGDGDPFGITGLSEEFRGNIYAYKYNSTYRILPQYIGSDLIFGVQKVTDQIGSVSHNTIITDQNDILSVSVGRINSLYVTDKEGAAEIGNLALPIQEWWDDNVNWNNAKNMRAALDTKRNTYMVSYSSAGSSVNDRVLGINLTTRDIFIWEDCEYPVIGTYFDVYRKKVMVGDDAHGLMSLEDDRFDVDGDPVTLDVQTGTISPIGNIKTTHNYTKAWLVCKPTRKDIKIDFMWYIDGSLVGTQEVSSIADAEGSLINSDIGGKIGIDDIGGLDEDLKVVPVDLYGEGKTIKFRIKQEPPEYDPDQECEIFGLVFEYEYNEDDEVDTSI